MEVLKAPVLATKYVCGVFLQKNRCLGELGHRRFIVFLVVDWICQKGVTVRRVAFGEYWD